MRNISQSPYVSFFNQPCGCLITALDHYQRDCHSLPYTHYHGVIPLFKGRSIWFKMAIRGGVENFLYNGGDRKKRRSLQKGRAGHFSPKNEEKTLILNSSLIKLIRNFHQLQNDS